MTEPRPFRAAGRLVDFMRQADEPGLINFAAGVPGLDSLPTEELQAAFMRAFSHDGAKMFAYHHPEGDHALREQLAARLQTRGAKVRGPELVTVTGCTQGVQLLISILIKPGDIVAVEAPAYYGMLEVLSVAGAKVLPLPITGPDGIDLDATEELLTRWKPRALIVCAALSNPSGVTIPESKRPRLVEICRKNGVRLIEDDKRAAERAPAHISERGDFDHAPLDVSLHFLWLQHVVQSIVKRPKIRPRVYPLRR